MTLLAIIILLATSVLLLGALSNAKEKNVEYAQIIDKQKEVINDQKHDLELNFNKLEEERNTFALKLKQYQSITEAATEDYAKSQEQIGEMMRIINELSKELLIHDKNKKLKWRSIEEPFEPQS